MSDDKQPAGPRGRRWFQFSLRALLLTTLLVSVLLAWKRERISRWVESLWAVAPEVTDDVGPPDDPRPWPVTIQITIAELAFDDKAGSFRGIGSALRNSSAPVSRRAGDSAVGATTDGLDLDGFSFGSVVLSASSERAIALIRTLPECRGLDLLSRPQVTTLNNQTAFVQVGQQVQFIGDVGDWMAAAERKTTIPLDIPSNVVLGVTPRVWKNGRVALEIDVEKSEIGPEAEGIPQSVLATGEVIRSPRINTSTLGTTAAASSGQTIVIGGLVSHDKPSAKELIIILTPRVIRNEGDEKETK